MASNDAHVSLSGNLPHGKGPTTAPRNAPGAPVSAHVAGELGELYRLLVESVVDYAIFALDPQGYVLSWNPGAERFKGYTAAEAIGQHFSIFYPPELVAEGFPEFELKTAATVGRFEDEGWRVRKDGTRFWANVVITALRSATGELLGFAKVTRDLSARREAEQALRESEERFRLLVEGVKDYAIFMLDPTGAIATWNEGAERIKGYAAPEVLGRHFSIFYPAADVAAGKPARELEIAARSGKYEEEGWRVRKDGNLIWASVLITALRNKSGELIGFAKVTRDLTEPRKAARQALDDARRAAAQEAARHEAESREAQLREMAAQLRQQTVELQSRTAEAEDARQRAEEARKLADEANLAKSQFLAAMSHELRTPLNAIGGYADLITMGLSGPVTPKQHEQLARVKRSQEHLLGIINDILNFSRIEAGQLTYDLKDVVIPEVVNEVVQMVAPQAHLKGLRIDDEQCRRDIAAHADRAKVEQIVLNLVSNAVKFTGAGGSITLSCESLDAQRIEVVVRDTGSGIPDDLLGAIFEPFVQVGRSLTAVGEGTGLGLAISRDLARAMQGDITVTSTLGVGSEFRLILPAANGPLVHRSATN